VSLDFGFLDALFDSVIIVRKDGVIAYCNEAAAKLLESSVRRLSKGMRISDLVAFENKDLFLMGGTLGLETPFPMTEINFALLKTEKKGKVQLTLQPFSIGDEPHVIGVLRDVSLEEVLHAKYHGQLQQKQVVIDELQVARGQLEEYSKNLESMVERRTAELKQANTMLSAIMNSLGQGFLVFDKSGQCGQIYTLACETILEKSPAGLMIWDVLALPDSDSESFKMWMAAVFGQKLEFDSLKDLAPSHYKHSGGRQVRLSYFTVNDLGNRPERIVLVATDITAEYEAQQALDREKDFAKMIVKMVTSQGPFKKFLDGFSFEVKSILTAVSKATGEFDYEWAFRVLHTLEGEAGAFGLEDLRKATRHPQEVLEPVKKGNVVFSTVRTEFEAATWKLLEAESTYRKENHALLESVGLSGVAKREVIEASLKRGVEFLRSSGLKSQDVEFFTSLLFEAPVNRLFVHYKDLITQLGEKLGKKIAPLHISNGDLLVPDGWLDQLASGFVHVFRNMVDHGIEPAEDRVMLGKPENGAVSLEFSEVLEGSRRFLQICAKDDGQGIHPEVIRKKLKANGQTQTEALSDREVIQAVFDAGFSTRTAIGDFSGRGIGMNVVKEVAESLGGTAWVESEVGKGTRTIVQIPFPQVKIPLLKSA
jgi:two-component system, chemotaxis family, sensor kinase CheA